MLLTKTRSHTSYSNESSLEDDLESLTEFIQATRLVKLSRHFCRTIGCTPWSNPERQNTARQPLRGHTQKYMSTLTSGLVCIDPVRMPDWGSRDPPPPGNRQLEKSVDVAQYRSQWCSFIRNLSFRVVVQIAILYPLYYYILSSSLRLKNKGWNVAIKARVWWCNVNDCKN